MKKYFPFIKYPATIILIFVLFANEGCLYDKPPILTSCDTLGKISYTKQVRPILTANCIRCHVSPNAPNGNGILLDDYAYVIIQGKNGQLIQAITHTGGVTPMPKDGGMLDSCSIAIIKMWKDQNYPSD